MNQFRRSPNKLGGFLGNLAQSVEALGSPKQESMFGAARVPSKSELLGAAIRETEREYGKSGDNLPEAPGGTLFEGQPGARGAAPGESAAGAQGKPPGPGEAPRRAATGRGSAEVAPGFWSDEKGSAPPDILGVGKFVKDDVAPTIKNASRTWREAVDDIRSALAPASRGPEAAETAHIVRAEASDLARRTDRAEFALRSARKLFASRDAGLNHDFMDRIERGQNQPSIEEQSIARTMRDMLDERRKQVQALGTGKLRGYYEHYFPHIWKDPAKAAEVIKDWYQRRSLEGGKSFLEQRAIPTIKDGLDAGLELDSDNPVDLVLRKVREMDKFVMAHRVMADMQDRGLAQFVHATDEEPEGWARINDKVATVYGQPTNEQSIQIDGRYVAPEPAARIINNYLSPGLREKSGVFRAYLGLANAMNQAQLGLSAFHLGFTTGDAVVSKFALGVNQIAHGEVAAGLKSIAQTPAAPFTNIMRGDKVLREWYQPGSQGAELARTVDAMVQAGGRARMDSFYRTNVTERMMDAFRKGNILGGVARAPFAAMEQTMRPVMEWVVPRQKMGVFADMARVELDRLGPEATEDAARAALARAWDSVDNRMGQLVYDNLFWNRTAKDLAMASVRSVGWNVGTIRELAGGAKDFGRAGLDLMKGKTPEFTPRMSYVVALPAVMGLAGSTMHYLMNGSAPEDLKDAFWPRDAEGARWNLPSYVKDVYEYSHQPIKTLRGKIHPLLNTILEMLSNRDYFNRPIRNEEDSIVDQARQLAEHVGSGFEPFAVREALRPDRGGSFGDKALPFVGITRAPKSLDAEP
jgi:hypothetical protein